MLGTTFFASSTGNTLFGLLRGDVPVHPVAIQNRLPISIGQDQLVIAIQIFGDGDINRAGEAVAAAGTKTVKRDLDIFL